jgi:hypothetical protein
VKRCFRGAFNARIWLELMISCDCSIAVQGDVDRASLTVESPSVNSLANGGAEHPVRGLLIPRKVFVVDSMLPLTLFRHLNCTSLHWKPKIPVLKSRCA